MTTARLPMIVSEPTASGILRVERMSITSAAMSVSAAPASPYRQPPGTTRACPKRLRPEKTLRRSHPAAQWPFRTGPKRRVSDARRRCRPPASRCPSRFLLSSGCELS
jgi:hypothetical protein